MSTISNHTTSITSTSLSATELRYWLALYRMSGVGAIRFFKLLAAFPQLGALFRTPAIQLIALGLSEEFTRALRNPDWAGVERDLAWAQQANQHILTYADTHYPPLLKQIAAPPPLLFVHGDVALLSAPQLAIVGSRNPSPIGLENARQFAQRLTASGLTITSGLALGIDAAGHRGALDTGNQTIAVLGSGLDRIYPDAHKKLAEKITANGALISEYPLGIAPSRKHFPQRNRIVSGLSLGVLVVEATVRSGSLITARLATEQGREVFAIPGSIHNPLARGCHYLIRQGAKLTETVDDIVEELGALRHFLQQALPLHTAARPAVSSNTPVLDKTQHMLLKYIGFEPTSIDQLITRSKLSVPTVTTLVVQLELAGRISNVPGGYMLNPPQ